MAPFRAVSRIIPRVSLTTSRPFSSSVTRFAGKEDALHNDSEHRSEKIDRLKKEGIDQKEWKEGLASNSEAVVKAEREKVESTDDHIKKLQKQTDEILRKES